MWVRSGCESWGQVAKSRRSGHITRLPRQRASRKEPRQIEYLGKAPLADGDRLGDGLAHLYAICGGIEETESHRALAIDRLAIMLEPPLVGESCAQR